MIQEAARMALQGATALEICNELGIERSTFYAWKHARPDFSDAIDRGRAHADTRVVESLYQRALGGTKTKIVYDGEGKIEQKVVEEVPGSDRAGLAWLYARGVWKPPRAEHELIVPVDQPPADPEQVDVRRMALATLALLREAPDAPVIEGSVAPYDTQEETDDGYDPLEEDAEEADFDL